MKKILSNPWVPWAATAAILLLTFWVWSARTRRPLEPLTLDAFKAAKARWKEKGPRSYRMLVTVSGVQQGEHAIDVENGEVVKMTTNGVPTPPGTWKYWSIEGMFDFLETELAQAQHPEAAYGVSDPNEVYLSAGFDAGLGYPKYFLRQVFGRNVTIEWEIRSLEPK